jgi:hypothetical protein
MMTDPTQHPPSGSSDSADSAESHVERAMLGPTPDNPSLSLKKRL